MQRKYLTLMFLGFFGVTHAQFLNDGATVTIQNGATLYIEGSVTNQNTGSIINDGTIEITDDLTNTATMTNQADSKVIFSGATDSNVDAGGATFAEVIINKDAGKQVILTSDATISEDLLFTGDDNLVTLGANTLTLAAAATVSSPDDNEYVNTNSTGELVKQSMTTFEYPVGNGSYNPVTLTEAGAADDKGVRVMPSPLDGGLTGSAITTKMADAAWVLTESAAGGSDLTVTPQWTAADNLTGLDLADLGVARYNGSSYDLMVADLGAATGADPYTATKSGFDDVGVFVVGGDPALSYIAVSPKVFLAGPYNGTDMNDDLRVGQLIPLLEPYTAMSTFTHVGRGGGEMVANITDFDGAVANENIVDWAFIELRDITDNTIVLATRAALLQRDGNVVDLDGGAVKFPGVAAADYHVVVRHRNHLGIMTNTTPSLSATTTVLDFTDGSLVTWGNGAQASLGGGLFGMLAGDANNNKEVTFNGFSNDKDAIILKLGFNPNGIILGAYETEDVNMNGEVTFNGFSNDKDFIVLQLLFNVNGINIEQLP